MSAAAFGPGLTITFYDQFKPIQSQKFLRCAITRDSGLHSYQAHARQPKQIVHVLARLGSAVFSFQHTTPPTFVCQYGWFEYFSFTLILIVEEETYWSKQKWKHCSNLWHVVFSFSKCKDFSQEFFISKNCSSGFLHSLNIQSLNKRLNKFKFLITIKRNSEGLYD